MEIKHWPISIRIKSSNTKSWQSQKLIIMLFLGFISIVYKQLEDTNSKNKDLIVKIYYMALKTILKRIYPSFIYDHLEKKRH